MHRAFGLKVGAILILIVLSNCGDLSAEAQLFRGRRHRTSCRSVPCCSCCDTRDNPGMCVIDLLYSSGTVWYYYAHHHENGTECPFYGEVIYPSPVPRSPVPMSCLDKQCLYPYSACSVGLALGLDAPIGGTEDLSTLMPASRATRLEELKGKITLPGGKTIDARIGVFKVKAPVVVNGSQQYVTEYFGFGLESVPSTTQDFHARQPKEHLIGSTPQKNLYEFKIGALKCVVLTVN